MDIPEVGYAHIGSRAASLAGPGEVLVSKQPATSQASRGRSGGSPSLLTSPARVRADIIRQMYTRDDTRDLAEVLMDLEADDLLRAQVVQLLTRIG